MNGITELVEVLGKKAADTCPNLPEGPDRKLMLAFFDGKVEFSKKDVEALTKLVKSVKAQNQSDTAVIRKFAGQIQPRG